MAWFGRRKPKPSDMGTQGGLPSALDALSDDDAERRLLRKGGASQAGRDEAVEADLAADMISDFDEEDDAVEHVWDALGADPSEVAGIKGTHAPGEFRTTEDLDTIFSDEDQMSKDLQDKEGGPEPSH